MAHRVVVVTLGETVVVEVSCKTGCSVLVDGCNVTDDKKVASASLMSPALLSAVVNNVAVGAG